MNNKVIIGVDEVGRGCLAGPVVAAAVVMPSLPDYVFRDSKSLSHCVRLHNYKLIKKCAFSVKVGYASPQEIDALNILKATQLAMKRAIEKVNWRDSLVLIDGCHLPDVKGYRMKAIIKGDQKYTQISAASIVAKVVRDYIMTRISRIYPNYLFEKHKGYPTKKHLAALKRYGALSIHRQSFRPVRDLHLMEI
ncbi:MAG: ribonuclease HII [Methylococcaceae bacterium TMED69]|nr:MAG: ribonuclease HII [Methylococcaceae bacterium TMED69]|tara:strand:- start:144 stop:722 length:579 start_codon:yes stop_codon:yes gene_type:complete